MSNRKIDNLREPSNVHFKVQTGFPTAVDAKEGTLTLRYISGTGLCLFAYHANKWNMIKLSPMNAKDETIVENLVVKNLEVDKTAKFKSSKIDISDKNLPEIKKWNKSYNDIRSGEVDVKFKKVNALANILTPEVSLEGSGQRVILTSEDGSLITTMNDATEEGKSFKITRDVSDGNPFIQIGSSDTECLQFIANYNSGLKGMDYAEIRTKSGSGTADKGQIKIYVDDVQIANIDDDGLNVTGDVTATGSIIGSLGGDVIIKAANDAAASILMQADNSDDAGDDWKIIANADQTLSIGNDIASAGTFVTHLDITPNATTRISLVSAKGHISVPAPTTAGTGGKIYLDGGGDTFIYEYVADLLQIIVGGDTFISLVESGTSGNTVVLQGTVVHDRGTTTYSNNTITSSGGTHDTDVDFRFTNKQYLQLTGDIAGDLNFIFPTGALAGSGDYLLILNQDSSGSHTVDDYKAFASASDGSPTDLLWAGGSEPTLTTTANKSDIISIFWDDDAGKAYATIETNF